MKYILSLVFMLFVAGCSQMPLAEKGQTEVNSAANVEVIDPDVITAENIPQQKLVDAVKNAIAKGDYRLYATTGRSTTFPGINAIYFKEVSTLCGKKFMSGTGDVIRSPEQRVERKKRLDYMGTFNQQMIIICRKQK